MLPHIDVIMVWAWVQIIRSRMLSQVDFCASIAVEAWCRISQREAAHAIART